jgi:Protein of unknown function (DUF1573)
MGAQSAKADFVAILARGFNRRARKEICMQLRIRLLLPPLALGVLLIGPATAGAPVPEPEGAPTAIVAEPSAAPASTVLIADKTAADAGELVEGAEPTFKFTLVNHGTETLKLKALTSCGCTVAHLDPTIAPGAQVVLEAKLNTRGLRGHVNKMVSVRTEGKSTARLDLQITATIRPLIRVEPSNAAYLTAQEGKPTSTEFTLTPEPGQGVELSEAVTSVPYLHARLSPAGAGGARKLVVTIAPDAPLGHLQGMVSVTTSSTVVPRVNLIVTGEKGISVSPQLVFWGVLPDGKAPAHEELTLTKHGGRFRIKKVESDDPLIKVKVEPVEAGTRYKLLVTYGGGWKSGLVRQNLTVTTDDPRQPVLKIPVQAVIGGPSAAGATTPPTF